MKVLIAEEMGMCFGVRDALGVLDEIAEPSKVAIHGQLVHNEVVLHQLSARGFQMADESDRSRLPETETVLVTAHGISHRERSRLANAGKKLIDTTCPLVRRVHDTAMRLQKEDYHVILIGRAGHVEVRGIVEDLEHFDVVETSGGVRAYPSRRLAVVCQTTVAPRTVAEVRVAIAAANPTSEIRFVDTTCQPTRNRQHAVEKLIPLVEAMVVVGGRNSNNTRELVELCRQHGLKTWQVRDVGDLQMEWFHGIDCVGMTAGTSTLDETIREVREWLHQCRPATVEQEHSLRWRQHFAKSKERLLSIPWEAGAVLTEEERRAVVPSLQDMQLCESSDGKNGLKLAAHYAERIHDPEYVTAMKLFFAEENRHSAYLRQYLEMAGEPTIQRSWSNFFFRRLRRLMGLETFVTVLLTAELIGMVCYRAFREATQCTVLRRICTQLMRDETMHLRFHIERLRLMYEGRSRLRRVLGRILLRSFYALASLGVWKRHGKAIRKGGYSFRRYWRETRHELSKALKQIG